MVKISRISKETNIVVVLVIFFFHVYFFHFVEDLEKFCLEISS